jgi:hypothetical protein
MRKAPASIAIKGRLAERANVLLHRSRTLTVPCLENMHIERADGQDGEGLRRCKRLRAQDPDNISCALEDALDAEALGNRKRMELLIEYWITGGYRFTRSITN